MNEKARKAPSHEEEERLDGVPWLVWVLSPLLPMVFVMVFVVMELL